MKRGRTPIEIEHTTDRQLFGPTSARVRNGGPLSDVLEWLTDLQANGVPDDADVRVINGTGTATWKDAQ